MILKIAKAFPQFNFLLVGGDPEDTERVKAEAAEKEITNVILTGFIPNEKLPLYQAAADILIMPYQQKISASSGGDIASYLSPMKLFEYMASERPILSTDLPVLREILNESNSILLSADDPGAWVQAIAMLEGSPELRQSLARNAKLNVDQYTWQYRINSIFRRVL